jgi:xanthine dehydrogenase small subunit
MAATPKRAKNAEQALAGANLDDPASRRAASVALSQDFTPLTDMRASAAYARRSPPTSLKRRSWKFQALARRPGSECFHAAE